MSGEMDEAGRGGWLVYAPGRAIHEDELAFRFVRASGPGGQNVNKVSTAVELRFDLAASPSLPPGTRARAAALAGSRLTDGGEILIFAERFRTQAANRRDAVQRLLELLGKASVAPKHRRPTRPGKAAKARRLDAKKQRGGVKAGRTRPTED
jgi:ribosome-associated protein